MNCAYSICVQMLTNIECRQIAQNKHNPSMSMSGGHTEKAVPWLELLAVNIEIS